MPAPMPSPPPADAAAGTPSLRTLGTGAQQAAAGNDGRFGTPSNAQTTPAASKIPLADGSGNIADGWLTNVGPGAGTYGGGGNIVESVTLSAKGRVTAVGLIATPGGSFSSAGGVFSLVGPAGATNPIGVWNFTLFNPAQTLAQNLTAANQTANTNMNLAAVGTPAYDFSSTFSGGAYVEPPISGSVQGGAYRSFDSNYAATTVNADVRLQAAMSMEWLGVVAAATGTVLIMACTGSGEGEAENAQYNLFHDAGAWKYVHENGAGVDNTITVLTTADLILTNSHPQHFCITRSGAGLVKFYVNGKAVFAGATGATALPTGGTNAELRIGQAGTGTSLLNLGARLFNVELTAAQVQESYRRTKYGLGA